MNAPAARTLPMATKPDPTALENTDLGGDDEIRKSDGVNGFRYSQLHGVWFVFKVLIGLPFIPFWPFILAWEARDVSLAKSYFSTLAYCLKIVSVHIRHGAFIRMLKYNLVLGPDVVKERILQRRGACTRCAKCCKQFSCIFLGKDQETQEHYCKIYGTEYWYYGTCGRYPLDQRDIDDHACPGFSFPDGDPAAKKAA